LEPLKLSDELVQDLQNAIVSHDPRAKDGGIAIQYYAAVIGYILAQQNYTTEQKKDFLDQLNAFSHHVFDDFSQQYQSPENEVVGKWRPGDP